MNFYISDTHFGHNNIIKTCNRPFKNADEMDEYIIKNWNEKVSKDDTVYILGDFCFRSSIYPSNYIKKLSGKKVLIFGNHDGIIKKDIAVLSKYFEEMTDYLCIKDGDKKIVLFHYPIVEWDGYFKGNLHFFGHIHNNVNNLAYKLIKDTPNAYNVSAEILNFCPQTKEDVILLNETFNKEKF